MNKQIKELLSQASSAVFAHQFELSDNPQPIQDAIQEKFAELIIEKLCYELMDVHGGNPERIALVAKQYGVNI